ncbi:hypothetical protein UFOVP154_18 [uncultured Caudovirales phage]|uniref:Uncharacterized protein n=1 Tax=uncultured Caudovirales phage TaxID=2100421 RepID=A0A6J7WDY2_9CAUD|nr:hypothetical protein UFOVP8_3 [uncultured Caudovirales phage]CAB5170334.1 hypothetical protein UFOVP154_18 [uncultured Caudovirales phage]
MPNWGVRVWLTRWGRWARTGMPGSLPHMSTTEKARIGRGGNGSDAQMPPDIAEIDHLICLTPPAEKRVLIVYYTQSGRKAEKAARLSMTVREFSELRERGESFVAINL